MIVDKIKELLEIKYQEPDFADCFTVEVSQNNTKVEVFVDSDGALDLRKCTKISRYLESIIDEAGWLGEKYTLEVSSPGASRPLVIRQYPKHIGRNVKVLVGEEEFEGKLTVVEENALTINYTTVEKVKKKKVKTEVNKSIVFDDIKEIKVIIGF